MKIFATSDLHFGSPNSDYLQLLKKEIENINPDVITISGDIYDYRAINPYIELDQFDIPVVFCLGNHEFAFRTVKYTLDFYKNNNTTKNVHCLDVQNFIDINNVRFVGNVLWYDGSLSDRPDKNYYLKNIDKNWLDSTIECFNPLKRNIECIQQIKNSLKDYNGKSVLLTHTVPYWKLNMFSYDTPNGIYNIYSGVKDLFHDNNINVNVAICGHTHRKSRVEYKQDGKSIKCYNVGNDYFRFGTKIEYDIIEI